MFWCILILLWPKIRARGMYAADTVTLSRDEMERRRLEAAEDLLNGITQARVARKFGPQLPAGAALWRDTARSGYVSARRRDGPAGSQPANLRRCARFSPPAPKLLVSKRIVGRRPGWRAPLRDVSPSATIRITWAASCTAWVYALRPLPLNPCGRFTRLAPGLKCMCKQAAPTMVKIVRFCVPGGTRRCHIRPAGRPRLPASPLA